MLVNIPAGLNNSDDYFLAFTVGIDKFEVHSEMFSLEGDVAESPEGQRSETVLLKQHGQVILLDTR